MQNPNEDPANVPVDLPPAKRLTAAANHYGESEVVRRSVALLAGANAGEAFLLWVGGPHAQGVLDGAPPLYWPELWGARALAYVWVDDEEVVAEATVAVAAGLANEAWRVREMCARVAAVRGLRLVSQLRPLLTDETPRVRASAARAFGAVGSAEDADALPDLLTDPDVEVRRAAGDAIRRLQAPSA